MNETLPSGWKRIERPAAWFRRYDFDGYAQTRLYLEWLGEESKRTGCYPDLSFGPRHVNVTLAIDGADAAQRAAFARRSEEFAERARAEGPARGEAAP